ncbi:MAG: RluA family pseudouridine synthase [Butyrivibrio sp.]|nr:RluA family pseudouridine synthase [Butyrivibrio sp.]
MDEINIVYEDDNIIVCAKPAGMATESARVGSMDVVSAVKNHIARENRNNKGRQGKNLPPYVALINRIDQPVEGLVLLAKDKKSAADMSRQLTDKRITKRYLTVVCGKPSEEKGKLVNYLSRSKNGDALVEEDDKNGAKKAILNYECLKTVEEKSLIKVELETGRFHQIRAQFANIGCPIYGDVRYGCKPEDTMLVGFGEIALCSYQLIFKHPVTGKKLDIVYKPESEVFNKYFKEEVESL